MCEQRTETVSQREKINETNVAEPGLSAAFIHMHVETLRHTEIRPVPTCALIHLPVLHPTRNISRHYIIYKVEG